MPLDLAIVTSVSNGYGRYLAEWADSIVALITRPAMVGIAHTESEAGDVAEARERLTQAGLRVETVRLPGDPNVGALRNAAVALSDTEWVQHLDADDMAMPHMLCDTAALMDSADVVAMGYERTGDLKAGPKFRKRTYSDTQGETTLRSTAPASGVSPFRRSFWERSPYRQDMIGGWDTALWLGFAHLGARFRATKRPCFWYRQHAGSTFNTRRKSDRLTAFVGPKLAALRSGASGVSVVVPWKPDGGPRDRAWEWVRERYATLYPDWEVVQGTCEGEEWRKGEAVADALTRATGLTLVIADADCVLPSPALPEAVEMVTSGKAPWVVPHTMVHRLDRDSTDAVLLSDPATDALSGDTIRTPYTGYAGGGFVIVDRCAYEAVGGIPRAFIGWGSEDEALALILDTLVGPHGRLPHDLWHLWHPPGQRLGSPAARANRQRLLHYQAAGDDVDAMWALVTGSPRQQTVAQRRAAIRRRILEQRKKRREQTGMTYLEAQRAKARVA